MKYALIKNGVVENVIVASDDFLSTLPGYDHIEALDSAEETKVAGPGWLYDSSTNTFTAPEVIETVNTTMTVLEFRSRFTQAEKIAIYNAADSNVEIRIWLDDLNAVRDGLVDSTDPRTVSSVQNIENAGLIAVGRANEILNIVD